MDFDVNYLAILLAAVASMIIGYVWYGPLFGKQWAMLMGYNLDDPTVKEKMKNDMKPAMVVTLISFLVMGFVMAQGVKAFSVSTVNEGLSLGFFPWLGYVLTTVAINGAWGNKKSKLVAIDSGHFLAVMLVMGIILALMQ